MNLNILSSQIFKKDGIHILTDRALGLCVSGLSHNMFKTKNKPEFVWLPLSQVEMVPYGKFTQIQVPSWLWEKNEIGCYSYWGQE